MYSVDNVHTAKMHMFHSDLVSHIKTEKRKKAYLFQIPFSMMQPWSMMLPLLCFSHTLRQWQDTV